MAKTLAFLRIKIGGDADGLQKALSQAERSVRKTSQSLTKLGKDLSAYVTVPLLA